MKMINADQITTNMNGSTLEIFIDGKLAAEISDGKTELGFVYDVLQGMDYEINEDNFVLRAFMFSPVLAIAFFLPDYLLADGQCDGKKK